jgi:hypothetical protein
MGRAYRMRWDKDGPGLRENHAFSACVILIRRRIIGEELLIMHNLRTKKRENVGWRYANQPFGG